MDDDELPESAGGMIFATMIGLLGILIFICGPMTAITIYVLTS